MIQEKNGLVLDWCEFELRVLLVVSDTYRGHYVVRANIVFSYMWWLDSLSLNLLSINTCKHDEIIAVSSFYLLRLSDLIQSFVDLFALDCFDVLESVCVEGDALLRYYEKSATREYEEGCDIDILLELNSIWYAPLATDSYEPDKFWPHNSVESVLVRNFSQIGLGHESALVEFNSGDGIERDLLFHKVEVHFILV